MIGNRIYLIWFIFRKYGVLEKVLVIVLLEKEIKLMYYIGLIYRWRVKMEGYIVRF